MHNISIINNSNIDEEVSIGIIPDTCPYCGKGVELIYKYGFSNKESESIFTVLQCPRNSCNKILLARYRYHKISYSDPNSPMGKPHYSYVETIPKSTILYKEFSKEINEISSSFVKIYNQSYNAEQLGLDQICGIGYRKSIEYLIKDFIIFDKPDKTEEIKNKFLGNCIETYISDENIKECAKRATWLGNDETHYLRHWEEHDVEDLKILLELVIYWISSNLLTRKYKAEMKEK
jgi:hypothetical protein